MSCRGKPAQTHGSVLICRTKQHHTHQKRTPFQVKFRSHISANMQKYNPVNLHTAANRPWTCLNSVGNLLFNTDFPSISVALILGMCIYISCWQSWAVLPAAGARSKLDERDGIWSLCPRFQHGSGRHSQSISVRYTLHTAHRWRGKPLQSTTRRKKCLNVSLSFLSFAVWLLSQPCRCEEG